MSGARTHEPEEATTELHSAIENPAADKKRMRRVFDAVMSPLKLAGPTAIRNTAIAVGNEISTDLMNYVHHLPH